MYDFERIIHTGRKLEDRLLSLSIETCYRSAPSLYSEIFLNPDGTGSLYWVYEMKPGRFLQLIKDFNKKYNPGKALKVTDIFNHPDFIDEYQKFNPPRSARIGTDLMPVIHRIVEEGLPTDVRHHSGADGHEYYLTTYGIRTSMYRSWVWVPKEWLLFSELLNVLISAGCWDKSYGCQIINNSGVILAAGSSAEIPPWMKP